MGEAGTFAGKRTFASAANGPVFYLTQIEFKQGKAVFHLPAMAARTLDAAERCILYAQPDATLRLQMYSRLWVMLDPALGWLMLTDQASAAVAVRLSGEPPGQQWEVWAADGWKRVYYTVDNPSPILSIHGDEGVPDTFVPIVITPSLAEIRSAKAARGVDLRRVDLRQENLDEIDFSDADFTSGSLDGATFAKATLRGAKLVDASLIGIRCDGGVLDRADMTRAKLDGTAWGAPASAVGILLTSCSARKATLGGPAALDCKCANLSGGDFRGADLSGCLLDSAEASGAILAGCKLDRAVLDGAKLVGAIAVGASFAGASMKEVNAQSATLVRADLSNADLTRARMGARAWLFAIDGAFARDLDEKPYVQPGLMEAFRSRGVTLRPADQVEVMVKGARWSITDPDGPYLLILNGSGQIDVFLANPDLRPATLRGAICRGTCASGASLAGADLRGLQWHSKPATLDHADLDGAALCDSLLVQTDFTQAYLAGADLSGCVLVQAAFRGCMLGANDSRRAFSLEGAMLQEVDFSEATLAGALLSGAAVALARGIPLFRLPKEAEPSLDAGQLAKLAPDFQKAGYPLGTGATLSQPKSWLLDNHGDPDPGSPRTYRVRSMGSVLQVSDADSGKRLFQLDPAYEQYLSRATASPELVAAFARASYSLCADAPISVEKLWQIEVGPDALGRSAVSYPIMRVFSESSNLPVYASVRLLLRDWPQYASGLAFNATIAIERAMNPATLGPSGYPKSWVAAGLMDWESLMTVIR